MPRDQQFWITCVFVGSLVLGSVVACGGTGGGDDCDPSSDSCGMCTPGGTDCPAGQHCAADGTCVADNPNCVGLECFQVDCSKKGLPDTTITGTVFAPNGTLPLYNVTVYVPNGPVLALPTGLACDRCENVLSGNPLVRTTTDTAGKFTLTNVPATKDVPLVIQVGRWRRQVTIPNVAACESMPLDAQLSRLPKSNAEGDIPRMALSTGGADALECLLRKIGLDDSEITTPTGDGRLHLYAGAGGTNKFDANNGGTSLPNATTLWADFTSLSKYDIAFLSCEGGQNAGSKPMTARAALKDFTDMGGRVFASHWHNIWIDSGPAPWPTTLTRVNLSDLNSITADIDQATPKGHDLAQWLLNVGASTTLGKIAITAAQHTVRAVNAALADRWIYLDTTANNQPSVQYMSFTTPVEVPPESRCGRVVFSDIHVASGDRSSGNLAFPSGGCTSNVNNMTPQEKVLAFMIFDIGACIDGPIL
jgi:hypothetical protein